MAGQPGRQGFDQQRQGKAFVAKGLAAEGQDAALRAGKEIDRVVAQLPVIAHQYRVRQAAAGIAALANQPKGNGRHAHVQQDRLALGRDTGSNRVGGVDRVDATVGADQPHRGVR
ncbi:hypothetical protein D3C81_1771100 [compost metagenome]